MILIQKVSSFLKIKTVKNKYYKNKSKLMMKIKDMNSKQLVL